MTSFVRCLCLILTLSMVGSPQGATIRTGSHSSSWWDSEASSRIWAQARKFETAGNFAAAEKLWEQGSSESARIGDITANVRYLTSPSAVRGAVPDRFQAALDALVQARNLAASIGDREDIGAISVNLSSLYLQMWDVTAAMRAVEDGRAAMASLPNPYFKPHLLCCELGRLHEILGGRSGGSASAKRALRRRGSQLDSGGGDHRQGLSGRRAPQTRTTGRSGSFRAG